MSERGDRDLLSDILEAMRRIRAYTAAMSYKDFLADTRTQDAVIRNLEIAGEATKRLSEGVRQKHPAVPWKGMAGVRDRLIHQYFGVNLDIVWDIVTGELPELAPLIEQILQSETGSR